jgi:hypothetical protein
MYSTLVYASGPLKNGQISLNSDGHCLKTKSLIKWSRLNLPIKILTLVWISNGVWKLLGCHAMPYACHPIYHCRVNIQYATPLQVSLRHLQLERKEFPTPNMQSLWCVDKPTSFSWADYYCFGYFMYFKLLICCCNLSYLVGPIGVLSNHMHLIFYSFFSNIKFNNDVLIVTNLSKDPKTLFYQTHFIQIESISLV